MAKSFLAVRRTALILAAALLAAGLAAPVTAIAQKAVDVKCKGCVNARDLGKKSVRAKHIKTGSVKETHIDDEAVTESKIKDDAITGAKIQNGSIGIDDLAAAAKPVGSNSEEGQQILAISGLTLVRTVEIVAPGDGLALVIASGSIGVSSSTTLVRCGISSSDSTFDADHEVFVAIDSTVAASIVPYSAARLYEVSEGSATFYFVCLESGGDGTLLDSTLSAAFIPNRY